MSCFQRLRRDSSEGGPGAKQHDLSQVAAEMPIATVRGAESKEKGIPYHDSYSRMTDINL